MGKILVFLFLIISISCLQYEEFDELNSTFEDILSSSECLATKKETEEFIKNNNINYKGTIDNNIKFIAGKCNPIILVPGIYSTRLKVRINCKSLKNDDTKIYEKIQFYCGTQICSNKNDKDRNLNLWFNVLGDGFSLLKNYYNSEKNEYEFVEEKKVEWNNQYGACLGFFMTIFNNEKECPTYGGSKKICQYSSNIRISYDGGFFDTLDDADCGVKAVENVLQTPHIQLKTPKTNVFGTLVKKLADLGYSTGFSLGAIPNDFRKFISTNDFAFESLKYLITHMNIITGKKVIIIAHSFGNLITLNTLKKDDNLKTKIKKWISLAPPFAGATKVVDNFLKGITDFNQPIESVGGYLRTEFEKFGQFIMLKSIPTVYELKPKAIFWDTFNDNNYKDFWTAIKERLELEKNCKNTECKKEFIENHSKIFNKYFGNYFPSLTLPECAYESSVEGNQDTMNKKCITEIFNIIDYPSFIKVNGASKYNIEDYKNAISKDIYYIANCKKLEDSNCVDNIFSEVPCVYDSFKPQLDDLIDRYNKKYGKTIQRKDFDSEEEVKETIKTMIDYQEKNSKINDLPIPPVDIDIVYSSFNPTLAAQFIENKYLDVQHIYNKGGDGTVPTWSSLLTGFKWIYEKEKNKLPQNIKLVEYCSRLSLTDIQLPNFKPIKCKCISGNGYADNLGDCSHQFMLSDEYLFGYINEEIAKDEKNIDNIKKAMEAYSTSQNYLKECNTELYELFSSEGTRKCSEDLPIIKKEYENNGCNKPTILPMSGKKCCSIHINYYNKDGDNLDEYFCDNIKKDKNSIKEYKEAEIEFRKFYYNEQQINVDITCRSEFLLNKLNLFILLIFILI